MSATNQTIDLGFFLNSLELNDYDSKDVFYTTLNGQEKIELADLYDIYLLSKQSTETQQRKLDIFTQAKGFEAAVFPEPNNLEFNLMRFYELFNYSPESFGEKAFRNCKHSEQADLALVSYQGKLALAYKNSKGLLDKTKTPVFVDFLEGSSAYRINAEVRSEAAVKSVIHKNKPAAEQYVLDATGGFGQDALLFASAGANVIILERNPVIGLLLADGLNRLRQADPDFAQRVTMRFPVSINSPSVRKMLKRDGYTFDTVYLDPMFPHKKSSALVNKNMQLIQAVVGQDSDADELLPSALQLQAKRIVVKRPKGAPFLNAQETKNNLETKSHRFDYYLGKENIAPSKPFAIIATRKDLLHKVRLENLPQLQELVGPSIEKLHSLASRYYENNMSNYGLGYFSRLAIPYIGYSRFLKRETILEGMLNVTELLHMRDRFLACQGEQNNQIFQTVFTEWNRATSFLNLPSAAQACRTYLESLATKYGADYFAQFISATELKDESTKYVKKAATKKATAKGSSKAGTKATTTKKTSKKAASSTEETVVTPKTAAKRTTKKAQTAVEESVTVAEKPQAKHATKKTAQASEVVEAEAKPKAKRSTKKAVTVEEVAQAEEKPKAKRATKKSAETSASDTVAAEKPKTKRSTKKAQDEVVEEVAQIAEKPKAKRATKKTTETPDASQVEAKTPTKRATKKSK